MQLLALVLVSLMINAPREWRDSIRDVYIDGRLDRNVQTLSSSAPRMLAVVCGDDVYLLDPESKAVTRAAIGELRFSPDRTRADSGRVVRSESAGEVVRTDDSTLLVTLEGRTMLVGAHQSPACLMAIEELWKTAPVWRSIADAYEPDAALVARLRAIDRPLQLQVVLATWCGDSRYHVPRLLKSVERAANPNLSVELIGVGPDFVTPMDVIAGTNITNVPTVIVRRAGEEIGRIVETPAAATVEADLADIAAGVMLPHPGRIERGAKIASGTYLHLDPRRNAEATERFEIYVRPGGGVIAHSVVSKRSGRTIETWASLDAASKPQFVEVTDRGATTTRTRFRPDGELWNAHSRGSDGGIIDQNVAMPAAIVTPATVTYGWSRSASSAYVVPDSGVGAIAKMTAEVGEGELPKCVRFADGSERRLIAAHPARPAS